MGNQQLHKNAESDNIAHIILVWSRTLELCREASGSLESQRDKGKKGKTQDSQNEQRTEI